MAETLKIALLRVLYSLGILTIGMIVNTVLDYYNHDESAYHVFTISWSLALFLIVYSLSVIAKPITSIYLAYLLFLCLSFINLCNAITFSTVHVDFSKIWFSVGIVLYSATFIKEAIKNKK